MKFITKMTPVAAAIAAVVASAPAQAVDYEVWVADQSNSVAGASLGTVGSYLNIFEGADVEDYIDAGGPSPSPIACPGAGAPCDVTALFPNALAEHDDSGATGGTLGSAVGEVARLHGALPDPQHKYVNMNFFAPGQALVGIMNAETKEAVALFRATGTNAGRSIHMTFWNADGTALMIANLHGRILERIDVTRDEHGDITDVTFNQSASLSVGASSISDSAKVYLGINSAGNPMMGSVSGAYTAEATGLLTPNGKCRQNGCGAGPDGSLGGRSANVIICPIVSSNEKVYITFGGGGLLVADADSTPMEIVGEYGKNVVNGAGCGGREAGGHMFLNADISAAGSGATQSTSTMYSLPTAYPDAGSSYPENFPRPRTLFKDAGNTATIGNLSGAASNGTGQLPGTSDRHGTHGMEKTVSGHHIHVVDRVQNEGRVYDTATGASDTYTLMNGTCSDVAIGDLPGTLSATELDDPAPDLMGRSPNGDFLYFAARGAKPVTVRHSAQGTCPGVGVIRMLDGGASGELAGVVRTTNTLDDADGTYAGGFAYTGAENSDPHGATVVVK